MFLMTPGGGPYDESIPPRLKDVRVIAGSIIAQENGLNFSMILPTLMLFDNRISKPVDPAESAISNHLKA